MTAERIDTDTTVVRALRKLRTPQTQRNRELWLSLFAFVVNGAAVAYRATGRPRASRLRAGGRRGRGRRGPAGRP